ncbi:MAG: phospho-sugar mutase, partial [Treponema sp.]|nr:phospho-sugar mutase [Treponema sp.]
MDKNACRERAKDYIARERDPGFRREVEELLENSSRNDECGSTALAELEDRFYRNLEFGTGGLRGVIGGGYNRMNTLVVKSATQGLAAYLIKTFPHKAQTGTLSAVLAYDSRHYSAE